MKLTKKPRTRTSHLASLLAAAVMLSGCAEIKQAENSFKQIENPFKQIENPFKQESTEDAAAKSALNAGIGFYDQGEYAAAVKKLSTSGEIWKASKDVQLQALKYMAFSYCVTSQPAACRHQFNRAFKLDPAFDLAPGEKGHPLWGPVFDRAKKQK